MMRTTTLIFMTFLLLTFSLNISNNNVHSHCPDLSLSSSCIAFSSSSIKGGDKVTISAEIHNYDLMDANNVNVSFYMNEIIIGEDLVDDWDKIERVTEYFGDDFVPYVIYLEANNEEDNVLSPKVIREMYNVSWAVSQLENVEGSISIADYINTLCKYEINITDELIYVDWIDLRRPHYILSGYYISDRYIQTYLDMLLGISSPSFDEPIMKTLAPVFSLMENLSFTLDLILSEDFTKEDSTAKTAMMIVHMNNTLSKAEIADLVDRIVKETEEAELESIRLWRTKLVRKGEVKLIGQKSISIPKNGSATASIQWNVPENDNDYMVEVRIARCDEKEKDLDNSASVIVRPEEDDVFIFYYGIILIISIVFVIFLLIRIFKK